MPHKLRYEDYPIGFGIMSRLGVSYDELIGTMLEDLTFLPECYKVIVRFSDGVKKILEKIN